MLGGGSALVLPAVTTLRKQCAGVASGDDATQDAPAPADPGRGASLALAPLGPGG